MNLVHLSAINGFAWSVLTEHKRRVFVLSILVFSGLCILTLLLPAVDHADRLKLLKNSSLSFSTIMAILLGILLSATALPRDEKEKFTYSLLTKPVSRMDMVIGKAIGSSLLAGIMIAVAAFVTYIFLMLANAFHDPQLESEVSREQDPLSVRASRSATRRSTKQVAPAATVAMGAVGLYGQDYSISELHGLFGGESLTWTFPKVSKESLGADAQILLRVRAFGKGGSVNRVWVSGQSATMGLGGLGGASAPQYKARSRSIFLTLTYSHGGREARRLVLARSREATVLPLPEELIGAEEDDFKVTVTNSDSAMVAVFNDVKDRAGEEEFGISLSEGSKSFAMNMFVGYFMLWLRVCVLIAFATAASTCLSAWTAVFFTILFAVIGASVPFMTEFSAKLSEPMVVHDHDSHGGHDHHDHDHDDHENEPSALQLASAHVLKGLVFIVPDLSLFDATTLIMKGQKIPASVLLRQLGIALFCFSVLLLAGGSAFLRRELG